MSVNGKRKAIPKLLSWDGSAGTSTSGRKADDLTLRLTSSLGSAASQKRQKVSPVGAASASNGGGTAAGADDASDRREQLVLKTMSKLDKTKDAAKRATLEAKLSRLLSAVSQDAAQAVAAKQKKRPAVAGVNGSSSFHFKAAVTPTGGLAGLAKVSLLAPGERAKRQDRMLRFSVGQDEDTAGGKDRLLRSAGVGTCESLEKEYLRLTSLPSASSVRPPSVLTLALDLAKARWRQRQDYTYTCEQLKSIRQDLTVQHVRDRLTVDAYETHGRIALEVGDMAEFRQCHGVLKQLYKEGVPGNREEFLAYGLLFALSTGQGVMLVSEMPVTDLAHPCVSHALAVCRAWKQGDYHSFSCLYASAPRMSPYLMDRLLPRMREWALQVMMCAYRPSPVPLSHLEAELAVEQDGADVAALARAAGGTVDLKEGVLDTRNSRPIIKGS